MKIGNVEIKGFASLAPMAGVADRAFRELCVRFGAGCVTSEMVSSKGLLYNDAKTEELMLLSDKERPAGIQLFGDDPAIMAQAAQKAMKYKPDFIDINMGCPAPKICSNGCGSALMKNPPLCADIVRAVKKAVDVPVTVKIRKGWDAKSVNAVEVAVLCEQAGADAVAVHGRTRDQMYMPSADWGIIKQVKQAVRIPVIGNGDITSAQEAAQMLEHTGCDLVMVGRGALGNPWIFSQINAYISSETLLPAPSIYEKMRVLSQHIRLLCEYKGEEHGMREARKHTAWYLKGFQGAAALRQQAVEMRTLAELDRLIENTLRENNR